MSSLAGMGSTTQYIMELTLLATLTPAFQRRYLPLARRKRPPAWWSRTTSSAKPDPTARHMMAPTSGWS